MEQGNGNIASKGERAQDTLLACWKKIGSLRQDRYFRTWMTRILINKCHDIQRNRKFYVKMEEWVEESAAEEFALE